MSGQIIHIHLAAPPQPALGAPCNGCGVCCLAEPCPLGLLVTWRLAGPCRALRWDPAARHYRCGLLGAEVGSGIGACRTGLVARLRRRLVARWIAAGAGCDATLDTSG